MSQPPIGAKEGKIWGTTQPVFAWNSTDSHLIRVYKGFRCSNHVHKSKWNRFLVIAGKLKVVVLQDGQEDVTILGPNQIADIPPGRLHRFESIEEVIAVEYYWVGLDPDDIERQDYGRKIKDV